MEVTLLICFLCFVAYAQAKSSYNHQDVTNNIITNFKIEEVEKVAEDIQKLVDKLKDIKHNYVDFSKEEFKKKSQNALDFIMKMPKECTPKRDEQIQQLSMHGFSSFFSCQGFSDALDTAEELLVTAENKGLEIAENLTVIAEEINTCTEKGPILVITCMIGLMGTIPEQIKDVLQIATSFVSEATIDLALIIADIGSCFTQASKLTDDKIFLLLEEVKNCATRGHNIVSEK